MGFVMGLFPKNSSDCNGVYKCIMAYILTRFIFNRGSINAMVESKRGSFALIYECPYFIEWFSQFITLFTKLYLLVDNIMVCRLVDSIRNIIKRKNQKNYDNYWVHGSSDSFDWNFIYWL